MSPDISSQNVGVGGVSKFWLPGKNHAPVGDGRVWNPFQNPNYWYKKAQIWLKIVCGTLDRQEYSLQIILSHVWAF